MVTFRLPSKISADRLKGNNMPKAQFWHGTALKASSNRPSCMLLGTTILFFNSFRLVLVLWSLLRQIELSICVIIVVQKSSSGEKESLSC